MLVRNQNGMKEIEIFLQILYAKRDTDDALISNSFKAAISQLLMYIFFLKRDLRIYSRFLNYIYSEELIIINYIFFLNSISLLLTI